jgi:hypothetical protein
MPVELVSESHSFRRHESICRESDFERSRPACSEREFAILAETFMQHSVAKHNLTVCRDLFDCHRRQRVKIVNLVWLDHHHPFDGWKPQPPVPSLPSGRLVSATRLAARHSVCLPKRHATDRAQLSISDIQKVAPRDPINAAGSAKPKVSRIVFEDAMDAIVKETVL